MCQWGVGYRSHVAPTFVFPGRYTFLSPALMWACTLQVPTVQAARSLLPPGPTSLMKWLPELHKASELPAFG